VTLSDVSIAHKPSQPHYDYCSFSTATVFVNGKNVGFHRGGYFKFTLDITDALKQAGQENELLVFVYDPTNSEGTLIPGKLLYLAGIVLDPKNLSLDLFFLLCFS
jgi:hypothetical protein